MQTAHDTAADSAEKCLIGSILVDRDVYPQVADRITVEAFSSNRRRAIFKAAGRCYQHRRPTDIVSVHAELSNDPDISNEQDWMSMAADLSESILHLYETGFACHGRSAT